MKLSHKSISAIFAIVLFSFGANWTAGQTVGITSPDKVISASLPPAYIPCPGDTTDGE